MLQKDFLQILAVKFKIPEPRRNYVVRKELIRRLKDIDNKKVSIIKGGAGSGKTTLLSSYVKENDIQNIRWLSIDKSMDGVFIFWKYIIENSKELLGESADKFESIYSGNMQKDNLWNILSLFINILYKNSEIIYVFDDFQNIKDEFLLSTIEFFIKNMPDNIHLVILTREMPNLYLGSLSMEDNLLIIDDEDIRMNEEESIEFLNKTLNLNLDDEDEKNMVEKSNGWVGGLQLMAMGSKKSKHLIEVNSSKKVIEEYITNEIYNYLTDEEKDFLIKTAIPSYFNKELCRELFKDVDFNNIMESILSKNLFVISISEEENVYRYHSIMKDYLNNIDFKDKRDIFIEEAKIFEELGDYEESINLLFEAKEYEILMSKLLSLPQDVVRSSYIMKVPIEEIKKNVDFAYQYFFNYYIALENEFCKKIYKVIIDNFSEEESLEAFKGVNLFFSINEPFEKKTIISLEEIEALNLNMITKAYLLILDAYLLFVNEKYVDSFKYLDKAEEVYKETNNEFIEMFIILERAMMYEEYGELNKALMEYKKNEKLLEGIKSIQVSFYIGIVGVYLKQLDLKNAEDCLNKAKEYIKFNNENIVAAYNYNYAEFLYYKGEYDASEKIIIELLNKELYNSPLYLCRLLKYIKIRKNNKELCYKFFNYYKDIDDKYKNLDSDLLYSEILFEENEIDEAIKIVDKIILTSRKRQNKYKIIEGDILKVQFLIDDENHKDELINKFIEAVVYSAEKRIASLLWLRKELVIKVIKKYKYEIYSRLSKEEIEFLESVVNYNKGNGIYDKNRFELTEREIEVLNEMKEGLTNKEIAEKLCISLATVKSHIINIYGKLGVNNRVAAVNKYN